MSDDLNLGAGFEQTQGVGANLQTVQSDPQSTEMTSAFLSSVSGGVGVEPGDVNGDGLVTATDIQALLLIFVGVQPVTADALAGGDVRPAPNKDGQITAEDLNAVFRRFLLDEAP